VILINLLILKENVKIVLKDVVNVGGITNVRNVKKDSFTLNKRCNVSKNAQMGISQIDKLILVFNVNMDVIAVNPYMSVALVRMIYT